MLVIAYVVAIWIVSTAAAGNVSAVEKSPQENSGIPCAILENFGGSVEVLDPSRTRIVTLNKNIGIPCGGWISSADDGWAMILHRDGHEFRIGPNTFIEIPDNASASADQVVLYRGEMFATTEGGGGELRIITANGRVRIQHGTSLVNFSPDEQATQLVALDGPASLENRFEPEKKVVAKPGESTSLDFKLLRVLPTFPKAVSVAALKSKLGQFRVNQTDQEKIYATAEARAERRLAADLSSTQDGSGAPGSAAPSSSIAARKLASQYSYAKTPMDADQAAELKARWVKKMTGGEDIGETILYPDKFYGKPRKVKLIITDPAEQMDARQRKTEDSEKRRLIEELSQIREE